eukprot:TRINITY_DN34013_c0_g1_i1.p1 TRINITY_DN34013_c0_g1~~TRINITY_DN34013_c0_g1_i1.p1  ORF type:complete len:621 (+),score=100.94 TRINITY_DN34013_c0_g1_i1:101-1963(+)
MVQPCPPPEKRARHAQPALPVCVIGGGSFGTAMACIVAHSVKAQCGDFDVKVRWYVRRPEVCEEINKRRTNAQYWEGALPENLLATSNLEEATAGAAVCILAVPSAFLTDMLDVLRASLSASCILVSVMKSLYIKNNEVVPCTRELAVALPGRPVAALMGPNLYKEMAKGEFAEATLAVTNDDAAQVLAKLFTTDKFHVKCVTDVEAVDLCGCVKNTFTLACGFAEGCGWGGNVKAAIIRHGLLEIASFVSEFLPKDRAGYMDPYKVILEACGVGDLMLSCTYGRGRQLASEFAKQDGRKTLEALQDEMMNGMKLPDMHNVQEAVALLKSKGRLDAYPLLVQTHAIAFGREHPSTIINALRGQRSNTDIQPEKCSFPLGLGGRICLVTGAANGIGRCIARTLARHCKKVVAVDRDNAGLKSFAEEVHNCSVHQCDLADTKSLKDLVTAAGPVDLLVNAAGVAIFQTFGEQTPEAWDLTMDVNTRAAWFLTQELGKGMAARSFGSVVNISSQSSTVAVSDRHLIYSTSKAAIDHVTRCSAYALAKSNVRVNAVNPTVVRTELAIKAHGEEGLRKMTQKVPLGRICEPEDVADAVLYLLSERARMITGVTVPVDGGFLAARV